METIGQRIKRFRIAKNLSQEELAKKLGYKSRSTINKIELGINDITQSKIVEFAKIFNVLPSDIMGWNSENSKQENLHIIGSNGKEIYLTSQQQKVLSKLLKLSEDGFAYASGYLDRLLELENEERKNKIGEIKKA